MQPWIETMLTSRSRRSWSLSAAACGAILAVLVIPMRTWGEAEEGRQTQPAEQTAAESPSARTNAAQAKDPSEPETTPLPKALQVFQGIWNFGACESELWTADLDEIQRTWTWKVQGQEITWLRWGQGIDRLSFSVDADRTPKQIDFTFLDGPNKGKKSQGIYEFGEGRLLVCLTEPGAAATRPARMAFTGGSRTGLLMLRKKPVVDATKAAGTANDASASVPSKTDVGARPGAPELSLLQGTFNVKSWTSERWKAEPDESRKWQWTIRGQEITWARPGVDAVKLSFTVNATVSPREIDFTFLSGPDQGAKCQGVYLPSRHEILLCFEDPGGKGGRSATYGAKPGSGQTSIKLVPARTLPVAEEVEALQGTWRFAIYYSDWWPERIANPPHSRPDWRWTIKGNEISWTRMKVDDVKLSFTVDPSKSPRQIDMTFLDGPHKGKTLRGMYHFNAEGRCQICFADPDTNADRPTGISYSTNEGRTMAFIEKIVSEPTEEARFPRR